MQTKLERLKGFNLPQSIRRGIEKESLRVTPDGTISQKPHPKSLGAALTHPYITTDYSEALLEFVTPVLSDPQEIINFLTDLHIFTLQNIENEILWTNSMPCLIESEETIPIAQYGKSNIGTMKSVYRHGLHHRYGSAMQAIAGIHFNFSLTDEFFKRLNDDKTPSQIFRSKLYMNAIRNIHRFSWVIPFFMGGSPAICRSFLGKKEMPATMVALDQVGTYGFEGATSLRLSNLGYTNSAQSSIDICYNSIETYVKGLKQAITTHDPQWQHIPHGPDNYQQLNDHILQLENEYYSEVRPKRPTHSGESPTHALLDRGIEYLELRSVDLNPFSPIGIELDQLLFLDVFLIYCLLKDNDGMTPEQTKKYRQNQEIVARHGRKPDQTLFDGQKSIKASEWVEEIFNSLLELAAFLNQSNGQYDYLRVIEENKQTVIKPERLPASRLLKEFHRQKYSYFGYTLEKSKSICAELKQQTLSAKVLQKLEQAAQQSFADQRLIEAKDQLSFHEFLQDYFARNRLP